VFKCFDSNTRCTDEKNELLADNDYLQCGLITKSGKTLVTTPVTVVCVIVAVALCMIGCSILLILKKRMNNNGNEFNNEELKKYLPEKIVIEPMSPEEEESIYKTCKVCMCNEKNTVFIPCGHICCCYDCSQKLEKCPICRAKITTVVKTFDV